MTATMLRAVKGKGKVHTVRKSERYAGYYTQNCDGRSVFAMVETDDPLTCKRCQEHEHR